MYEDEIHLTHPVHPIGTDAIPEKELHWYYNTQGGILATHQFITCLMAGLRKAALELINYDKLLDVVQDKMENPFQFLQHFKQVFLHYTNLDPEGSKGRQLIMTYFFFFPQSYPGIMAKLKNLERGRLTP